MFSPEEQQMQICLLKSNLEEVENDIVVTKSAMPSLDAENEQKYHKTLNALRISRSLNTEIERLKLENVQLTAKRMQLKKQCEAMSASVDKSRDHRVMLETEVRREQACVESEIRKYEDTLSEIAQRFRQTRAFANEEEINNEIEMIKNITIELEAEEACRQDDVRKLQFEIEELSTGVPEDILNVIGKQEAEEKIKALTDEIEALTSKKEHLVKCRGNMAHFLTRIL
ncbi:uncharacterized protein LOC123696950 [Colias croceus]|uniref:uncharacterized protein LOC123696950 n=1 Tax=Colias crocea TaxID=72248 RepID=UPI001E281185|nr:uncharacterized protein LOC123696950 [Colias croceus]